ncbi:NnrU family protein [Pelagivirga sediminicola]|uniref:NnrU family protein n=1 Tax=Pelagivirga sediminicola TaxID=2170575 RepID=A0A2T7G8D8_9RHOB|nr:NnrU family protein [Pelagivirga sediminicola]PVA10685.1 NnrU family protein [Pelagivirga sediminicola]
MGWTWFALAFVAFFASHSIPLRPPVRARLVSALGRRGFTLAYSALSLAALAWLIAAAANAPYVGLWPRAAWQNWVPLVAMGAVCVMSSFGAARPNPLSFGGARNGDFDANHPGILRWMRHPLLMAAALWAGAHMVPNGDLAHIILFGVFAVFAVLGMRIVDRRKRREMGAEEWQALRRRIANGPLVPRPASWRGVAVRLLLAVGIYVALLALHPVILGVSPLP